MKKILAAIDIGSLSEKILINAQKLRQSVDGELAIISVTDLIINLSDSGNTPVELVTADKNYRKEFIKNLLKINNFECNQLFFETGNPKQIILDIAHKWQADIIAIGTHAREKVEHLLMGNVAENSIKNSDIPVLIITSKT